MPVRLSALLALAAVLALPAAAQAFTASKVTAPTDGFHSVAGAGGTLDIRAEITGAGPADKADLVCVVLRSSFRVLFEAADAGSGTVEKTIDLSDLRAGTCLILAVPDGTDVAKDDLTRFTGPIITTDWRETHRTPPGNASGDVPYDFLFAQQQARGYGDYGGISSCGVCDTSLLFADTRRASEFMFFGNAWLDVAEPAPRMRSHLRIDGHNAFGAFAGGMDVEPGAGETPGSVMEGVPPLAATAAGGRGEDLVIDEGEDLVRCSNGDAMPVTVLGCGRFVGTGVRLARRIRQTREGTLVHVDDVFRSADGREHALDLHWLNTFRDPPGTPEPSFQLPWTGDAYAVPSGGQQRPAPPGAPFTIFARANHHAADGERPWPQGAIVFDTPASGPVEFFSRTEFIVPMSLTVPAGGEVRVRQSFVTALTRAEAAEVAASVADGFAAPAGPVDPPPDGGPFPVPPDRTKPVLSRVTLSPKRFRPGGGATLRFELSEPAAVRATVARPLAGRRAGGRCRRPTRSLRGRTPCVRLKRLGTVSRAGRSGANRIRVGARVAGRTLRPRAYRLLVDAADAAGNRSAARTLRFRITRR